MIYTLQEKGLTWAGDSIERGSQSWTREVTVRWEGFTLRAHVERDSYDTQSRIYVEVFSKPELKWNRVQSLVGKAHSDLPSSSERDDIKIYTGSEDLVRELFAYAQVVLDGVTV